MPNVPVNWLPTDQGASKWLQAYGPIDPTPGDIGTIDLIARAGATGQASDAGHTHPVAANALSGLAFSQAIVSDQYSASAATVGAWTTIFTNTWTPLVAGNSHSLIAVTIGLAISVGGGGGGEFALAALVDSTRVNIGLAYGVASGVTALGSGIAIVGSLSQSVHAFAIQYYATVAATLFLRPSSNPSVEPLTVNIWEYKR